MIASELPVYVDTFCLVNTIVDYTSSFPKAYKFTIGQKLTNVALELFEYIQLANMTTDYASRSRYLQGFQIKHELVKALLRLCSEKRILSLKQTANLAKMNDGIGKQISAWKNRRKPEPQNQQGQGVAERGNLQERKGLSTSF